MKKIFTLGAAILAYCSISHAQDRPGAKYLNIGYVSQTIRIDAEGSEQFKMKSNFGAAFNSGRTFFLTKEPVAKMLHFGIDWTYIDLNYAKYKQEYDDGFEDVEMDTHKAEIGMQVGPSVHLALKDGISVSAYLRYAPGYSMMYAEDEFSGGYAGLMVAGAAFNYSAFGIGVENRWGKSKHSFNLDMEDFEEGESTSVKQTLKLSGPRIFLAFRF